MSLCRWAHRCAPHELDFSRDSPTATCRLCDRAWEEYIDLQGRTRARLDIEMDLPEWATDELVTQFVNLVTGEVIDAAKARPCGYVEQRAGPCGICCANPSRSEQPTADRIRRTRDDESQTADEPGRQHRPAAAWPSSRRSSETDPPNGRCPY